VVVAIMQATSVVMDIRSIFMRILHQVRGCDSGLMTVRPAIVTLGDYNHHAIAE